MTVQLTFRVIILAGIAAAIRIQTANATSLMTWVSAAGKDNSTCEVTNPCATLQKAHDVTTAGGVVSIMTSGAYGALIITKSISVVAPEGVQAVIKVPSTQVANQREYGITVNAGAADIVVLKGLTVIGNGRSENPFSVGITINDARSVTIDHAFVTNCTWGINPENKQGQFVLIRNSILQSNFFGIFGGVPVLVYLGQNTISGNVYGESGALYAYGDNDINGNTTEDIEGTITEVSHDQ